MASLRTRNLLIKSFANPFVDIALTFFDNFSSFNSFLFNFFSLLSKSVFVFFTKLVISLLLAKLTCANLALKFLMLTY